MKNKEEVQPEQSKPTERFVAGAIPEKYKNILYDNVEDKEISDQEFKAYVMNKLKEIHGSLKN